MQSNQQLKYFSEAQYLEAERLSETKHEYVDGDVFAIAGASKNHERISGNVYRKFGNHLENSHCEPFASDMKVDDTADALFSCRQHHIHCYRSHFNGG